MKKGVGVFLIVIGGFIFLSSGYLCCNYMIPENIMKAHFERNGLNPNQMYREGFDAHVKRGRLVSGVVTLFGLGIGLIGYYRIKK